MEPSVRAAPKLLRLTDRGRTAAVIFDGDDTLWETESLYDLARSEAAQIVASTGYDPDQFEELQRSIDATKVQTMGLSAARFPASSVEAFTELARRAGGTPTPEALERVAVASAKVFAKKAPLVPFAEQLLSELVESFRLALVTKGDEAVQKTRVEASGLRHYFDRVEIVSNKNADTFLRLLHRLDAIPTESWSIGNSLPSDVGPALEAGMQAIWIDAHVWSHERRQHSVDMSNPHLHVASHLRDVPMILASVGQPAP
ncbi:MAG: HAD family hydrolase [Acidimicrobiales bacterium]